MNRRKGFTLIELLVVVAIIALLISILLPSLARAREITKRAVCASNLKGVGQGMKVYSNDNADWFPIAPFTENTTQTGNATAIDFIGKMANNLVSQNTGTGLSTVHPSRSLFLLVIDGTCTAKQFICPSSGDGEDDMRNTSGTTQVAAQPGQTRFDFRGYPFLSYGYQMPFGPRAKPNENLDSRTAIAADKGPFYQAGTGAAGYTDWTTADTCATNMTMDLSITLSQVSSTDASAILKADNEKWRPYNSRNHSSEGENVLYQDGHVDFVKKPICGVNYDNIYTIQGPAYTLPNSLLGKTPKQKVGPLTQSDSVIVP